MAILLRALYYALAKIAKENIKLDVSFKPTETGTEAILQLRGIFTQDDMRSLYLSRLWTVRIDLVDGLPMITLVAKLTDIVPDEVLEEGHELSEPEEPIAETKPVIDLPFKDI